MKDRQLLQNNDEKVFLQMKENGMGALKRRLGRLEPLLRKKNDANNGNKTFREKMISRKRPHHFTFVKQKFIENLNQLFVRRRNDCLM